MRDRVHHVRETWPSVLLLLLAVSVSSCRESANDRARKATLRARAEASTRESEVVRRVTTPEDPHRLVYHAPTDLSATSARLTNAPIVGIEKVPQPTEPSVHSGPPPAKPRE
jgi:hypothetical protein